MMGKDNPGSGPASVWNLAEEQTVEIKKNMMVATRKSAKFQATPWTNNLKLNKEFGIAKNILCPKIQFSLRH